MLLCNLLYVTIYNKLYKGFITEYNEFNHYPLTSLAAPQKSQIKKPFRYCYMQIFELASLTWELRQESSTQYEQNQRAQISL